MNSKSTSPKVLVKGARKMNAECIMKGLRMLSLESSNNMCSVPPDEEKASVHTLYYDTRKEQ